MAGPRIAKEISKPKMQVLNNIKLTPKQLEVWNS